MVAVVGDCRSLGPVHTAPVVGVVCVPALVEAVARMRLRRCTVAAAAAAAAAVHFHIRPAGHCSSHRPSRAARIRADRSRSRSTAGRTGCRSLHTAAVPAAHVAGRSIGVAAVAVAVAASGRRAAADMSWRRGERYRAKPHAPGASIVE